MFSHPAYPVQGTAVQESLFSSYRKFNYFLFVLRSSVDDKLELKIYIICFGKKALKIRISCYFVVSLSLFFLLVDDVFFTKHYSVY